MPIRGGDNPLGSEGPLRGGNKPSKGVGGPLSGSGGFIMCLSVFPNKVPLGTHGAIVVSTTSTRYPCGFFIKKTLTIPNLFYWTDPKLMFKCFKKPFMLMVRSMMLT